jgi:hypothetical protein
MFRQRPIFKIAPTPRRSLTCRFFPTQDLREMIGETISHYRIVEVTSVTWFLFDNRL